jgi:DNA replication protein DnaC
MERTDVLELMAGLKLYGMRAAYDEVMATGIKRRHEPPRILGDLLNAEIAEKRARSIKYQLTVAKLPLAKDIDEFDFVGTPINEALVRDLASGSFLAEQRNAVLIGGTGTGKSHLAIAIARACIRGTWLRRLPMREARISTCCFPRLPANRTAARDHAGR